MIFQPACPPPAGNAHTDPLLGEAGDVGVNPSNESAQIFEAADQEGDAEERHKPEKSGRGFEFLHQFALS